MLTKERIEDIARDGTAASKCSLAELRELCDSALRHLSEPSIYTTLARLEDENKALRGMGGEAVGECVKATGSLKDMMIIRWRDGFTPHEGQLLYTAPAASHGDLAKRLRELGALVPCRTGGTFENDPPDAIIDAAIRYLNSAKTVAAALGGGE